MDYEALRTVQVKAWQEANRSGLWGRLPSRAHYFADMHATLGAAILLHRRQWPVAEVREGDQHHDSPHDPGTRIHEPLGIPICLANGMLLAFFYCGQHNIDFVEAVEHEHGRVSMPLPRIGLTFDEQVVHLHEAVAQASMAATEIPALVDFAHMLMLTCRRQGIDLLDAMETKLLYESVKPTFETDGTDSVSS